LDVRHRESWAIGEQLIEVGVVGEVLKDNLNRDPCPLDHGLPGQDRGVLIDAVIRDILINSHRELRVRSNL
jgi:hypothetical protein